MAHFIIFILSSYLFASSSSLTPDDLAVLDPVKKSNSVLLSDSECSSCQKLIQELPKICKLKPGTFDVFAVGNIKKNKKKLSSYEKNFNVIYSQKRKLLMKLDTPATPSMLINKKHFVIGRRSILKYFKKHKDHYCESKSNAS